MPTRERASDRGARTARHDLATVGTEIRAARLSAGLSLRDVGRATGMSYSQVGRLERAALPSATPLQLARVGAAVGLDVRIRAFPGPSAVRDQAHVALLARFRARLGRPLSLRLEVPIPLDHDQRAWDGVVAGFVDRPRAVLPVEAETRLFDVQAQLRRVQLKCRDGGASELVLLAADTEANRRAARLSRSIMADQFPVPARQALSALAAGRHPGGASLLFL